MTIETLKTVLGARPFLPFTVRLADGRSLRVEHPEFVAYAGGRVMVILHPDDRVNHVDPLLVTDLEVDPPTAAAAGRDSTGAN